MASDCAVDTARSAAICSPSSSTPRSPPTTTAVNANCGPPRPTARSPAASAPNGARTCSPPSAPLSAPHSDAELTPIRRSKPPYTAAQRSNRVEQIPKLQPMFPEYYRQNFDMSYERLGEKGTYSEYGPGWASTSMTPFSNYKGSAAEGGVRAPFIIRYPGRVPQGRVADAFTYVLD